MACALCEIRKEKRFCPAIHGRICSTCCGEQREVSLDCPSDCPYLRQARRQESPRRLEEMDPALLFSQVEIPEGFLYEQEPLIVGFAFGILKCARLDRALHDQDVLAALRSLASSYETRVNSGLLVSPSAPGAGQQAILRKLEELITEYRKLEEQHLGYSRLRDSDLLRVLIFTLRLGLARTNGRPRSRSFLDFLAAQFPEKTGLASAASTPSRIVMP